MSRVVADGAGITQGWQLESVVWCRAKVSCVCEASDEGSDDEGRESFLSFPHNCHSPKVKDPHNGCTPPQCAMASLDPQRLLTTTPRSLLLDFRYSQQAQDSGTS